MTRDPFDNTGALIRRVYAYVAYRIGDGPECEDVTSETFERALRYRGSFDAQRGDPAAWLIGIARRCIVDAALARMHLADADNEPAPGDLATDTAARVDLERALVELGDRDRELIALRYGADLAAGQIAELFGVRTNTVEVALHRALAKLRHELEPERARRTPAARPAI